MTELYLPVATVIFLASIAGITFISRRESRPRDSLKVPFFSETFLVTVLAFIGFIALAFMFSYV